METFIIVNDKSEQGFRDLMEQMASPVVICKSDDMAARQLALLPDVAKAFGKTEREAAAALLRAVAERAQ